MHITEHHRRNFQVQWDRWLDDLDRLDIRTRPENPSEHPAVRAELPHPDTPDADSDPCG